MRLNVEPSGARRPDSCEAPLLRSASGCCAMKALLVVSSVKRDADEKQHDGKHDDAIENFHGYSFPI